MTTKVSCQVLPLLVQTALSPPEGASARVQVVMSGILSQPMSVMALAVPTIWPSDTAASADMSSPAGTIITISPKGVSDAWVSTSIVTSASAPF